MRRLRNAFVLGLTVGLVVALVRRLTAPPAATRPSAAAARSTSPPSGAAGPARAPRTSDATSQADGDVTTGTDIERAPTTTLEPAPTHDIETTWAPPIDGACPPGFPVKAKESSRIFHVPGGLSYDRTNPDRCYPTPEAAEADGFRAAKR